MKLFENIAPKKKWSFKKLYLEKEWLDTVLPNECAPIQCIRVTHKVIAWTATLNQDISHDFNERTTLFQIRVKFSKSSRRYQKIDIT